MPTVPYDVAVAVVELVPRPVLSVQVGIAAVTAGEPPARRRVQAAVGVVLAVTVPVWRTEVLPVALGDGGVGVVGQAVPCRK